MHQPPVSVRELAALRHAVQAAQAALATGHRAVRDATWLLGGTIPLPIPGHHWVRVYAGRVRHPGHDWTIRGLVRRDTYSALGWGLIVMRLPHAPTTAREPR